MFKFILAFSAVFPMTLGFSFADECADMRLQIENFWQLGKGKVSPTLNLVPMALSGKNPTTTMPQLGMVCRKDSNGGTVTIYGDGVPYNAPLNSNECRLVFTLGVETITAKANDDLEGPEACGSFEVIR
ncbi:hypothetical protein [Roseibium polysiphoniae]|uniref:hypothetical protein n=1 Tax=Roseibium polysiphoniae TaxID=2571221 RepID=UPI0032980A73